MDREWPPKHVTPVKDRHGKKRYRYRRTGVKSCYIKHQPKSAEFWEEYDRLEMLGTASEPAEVLRTFTPRSMDDLAAKVKRAPAWKRMKPQGQRTKASIIERLLDKKNEGGRRLGERQVGAVTVAMLDGILGKMSDTPGAADNFRKEMKRLFGYAVKLGWRADNPASMTDPIPAGAGFHTWTDDEIEQFRSRHALGTMARLTLELALNTSARACNLNDIERTHIIRGKLHVAHAKDNHEAIVPLLPETKAAIDALPVAPIRYLITTVFGKPFSDKGISNKMRQWCDEAELPHCSLHGIRKATSRQLAESGASDAQGRAVTGHKKDATFAYYAKMADREKLAEQALSNLQASQIVQPSEKDGTTGV